jgi:hypothetical protein
MCIKNQQKYLITLMYFYCDIFPLHVSAGNPAIFRVTFLIQEYSVIKCVKFLHNIEIPMIQCCGGICHDKNTSVELSAFCWFLATLYKSLHGMWNILKYVYLFILYSPY